MRAGTQLDPFPQSYEGDPMVSLREEVPPRDPEEDEEEEDEESEDLKAPDPSEDDDDDDDVAGLKKAMRKLEGKEKK